MSTGGAVMAKPRMTRREQSAMETRNIILTAALDLIAQKGYKSVTVHDICHKAGVSRSTFYNHFTSKEQIAVEEFQKIDNFYTDMAPKIRSKKTFAARMTAFVTQSLRHIEDIGINTIRVASYTQIGPGMTDVPGASPQRALYRIVEQLVAEAQKNGEIRTDISANRIAQTLIRFIRGVIYEWCLQNGNFNLVAAGKDYVAITVKGLSLRNA
jgi:TetR/AcrR family fatty acid metabolism transcriptional regulator